MHPPLSIQFGTKLLNQKKCVYVLVNYPTLNNNLTPKVVVFPHCQKFLNMLIALGGARMIAGELGVVDPSREEGNLTREVGGVEDLP